jgi:NAD(P)-dependent dehydrogenase (short-subunit alcohol dehydrogenase family)
VIVPARRPETAAEALASIDGVTVEALDLGDLASVEEFAGRLLGSGVTLDMVIDSAGIMACPETRVGPGWEAQLATNHLGHFAMVNRLWPALAPGARVVSVSSMGHLSSPIRWDDLMFETGYEKWTAYGQAKTANVLFAVHLDRLGQTHERGNGVRAFALHPGGILTPLQRHLPHEEQVAMGWITEDGTPRAEFKTPEQGAATQVWAATSPQLEGKGGVYCEDVDVAVRYADGARRGVRDWATDPEQAARLWQVSAELTGVDAFA